MEDSNLKKKIFLSVIVILLLVTTVIGISVAFFNYTRTGGANTVRVGRIYFNSTQDRTITLSNVFPISSEDLENDENNHDSITINIEGDTEYSEGIV